jgi:RNA polymerase sigma factor (sigma-70 family)
VNNNTGNNLADQYMVEKVLSGDTQAFGTIIKNTEKLVAQIVFKMISNSEDRKDIAQDIYIKAFKKLSGFKFQSKLSTWIAQISYNTCLDYLRKKKLFMPGDSYEGSNPQEDVPDRLNKEFHNIRGNVATTIMRQKELSAILKTEIEKLSPVYKTLITLYHNEELTYGEMEQITGLPAGTIKSYLFRARKTLKNNLLLNYKKEDL